MKEIKLKARAIVDAEQVILEFGRAQATMEFSARGKMQRKLRVKDKDILEIMIRKDTH